MPTKHSTFFVQSTHGTTGNFEMLVPRLAGGGAAHFWRDNDDPVLPWVESGLAFGSPDDVYALSLVQGPLGGAGNLEVVALEGSQLVHHWRDDDGSWRWQARTLLPGSVAVARSVALIQSSHGSLGNYEVVAPVAASGGGGLAHWWRDNDTPGLPWNGPTLFGGGGVEAVAMTQSGGFGNLEALCRVGDGLVHYWRDDDHTWGWNGPYAIPGSAGIQGQHAFLEGPEGNFEVIAPLGDGGFGHWWRDNNDPELSWHGPTVVGGGDLQAVAAIESSYGSLEVLARSGATVQHYWRDNDSGEWHGPTVIVDMTPSEPSLAGASEIAFKPPMVAIHAAIARTRQAAHLGQY